MCVEDLGSGLLVDLSEYGLEEPTVSQSIKAGVDIVTFSGDKLLGGPQCGIILGKAKYINELRSNPLMRALRVDKMTLAALSATLSVYRYSDNPVKEIPHLRMITEPASAVKARTRRVVKGLKPHTGYQTSVVRSSAAVGGGSCPGLVIPSWSVRILSDKHSAQKLAEVLRRQNPPVIATVSVEGLNIDMRTVPPGQTRTLTSVLNSVMG
jgi:L-seryl-tRNA(Ser) seleniumtransferase